MHPKATQTTIAGLIEDLPKQVNSNRLCPELDLVSRCLGWVHRSVKSLQVACREVVQYRCELERRLNILSVPLTLNNGLTRSGWFISCRHKSSWWMFACREDVHMYITFDGLPQIASIYLRTASRLHFTSSFTCPCANTKARKDIDEHIINEI